MEKTLWLGKTIKILRLESDLSLEELSKRSGIPMLELIKVEDEQRALSSEELEQLLKAFEAGEQELLSQRQPLENNKRQDVVNVLTENNVFGESLEKLREMDLFLDSMHTQYQINEYLSGNSNDNGNFLKEEKLNRIKEMSLEESKVDSIKQQLKEQGYYEI